MRVNVRNSVYRIDETVRLSVRSRPLDRSPNVLEITIEGRNCLSPDAMLSASAMSAPRTLRFRFGREYVYEWDSASADAARRLVFDSEWPRGITWRRTDAANRESFAPPCQPP